MIHILSQHIAKGSYTPWYKIINFNEPHLFHEFEDNQIVEKKIIGEPPYIDLFVNKLNEISPSKGDIIMFDVDYLYDSKYTYEEFYDFINKLSTKYNNCKFVMFEDDSTFEYIDTKTFTIFSNKFNKEENVSNYNLNCNYFRYRNQHQDFFKSVKDVVNIFKQNIRQKKTALLILIAY